VHIDWATLGAIAVVAAAVALTTVLLVAFALVGSSTRSGRRTVTGTALSALCLAAAGLIVCYGLYLIVA
jgi:hypothetical protein